jgi:hypothetical protein
LNEAPVRIVLGVDRDRGPASAQELFDRGIDELELAVVVRMAAAFPTLPIGLHAIAQVIE